MNSDSPDPIIGDWEFTNNNVCSFTADGNVVLCGSRVGIWKMVKDRHHFVAYLRGQFGGASDPLEIQPDGWSIRWLANGKLTRLIERADDQSDPTSIVGKWDFKNGNIATFTPDGWNELCGMRVGIWVREGENTFLNVYLRGKFQLVAPDASNVIKSMALPGLWMHTVQIANRDCMQAVGVIERNISRDGHVAFRRSMGLKGLD